MITEPELHPNPARTLPDFRFRRFGTRVARLCDTGGRDGDSQGAAGGLPARTTLDGCSGELVTISQPGPSLGGKAG